MRQDHLNLLAYMVNHIGDELMLIDREGRVVFVNEAAVRGLGYSRKEILNRAVSDFFEKRISANHWKQKYFAVLQKGKQPVSYRIRRITKGGEHQTIDVTAVYMPYKSEGYVLSVGRDVTQQLQIEELMHESQKMEAIQYFVSGTTQELKFPLLAVIKRISSLEKKYQTRGFEYIGYKEFISIIAALGDIHQQISRCYDTISRLTRLNKKRLKFERKYCQANDVIRATLRLKENYMKLNNIHYRLRLVERLPLIAIEEIEFNQVVSNIVDNAIQSMPGGGKLSVSTVHLKKDDKVQIDIVDEGVGISSEDLPHIFEPFFTTKQRGIDKSTGLGLSVAYALVKDNEGQIQIKSSLRKGTAVRLTFPALNKE